MFSLLFSGSYKESLVDASPLGFRLFGSVVDFETTTRKPKSDNSPF
jgi:hypothetical protein